MLVGCGGVSTPKFNAPKSNTASSAVTGTPIHLKYSVERTQHGGSRWGELNYYLFSAGSRTAFATTDVNNRRNRNVKLTWKLFDINSAIQYYYGTLGDKAVFTFSNGLSGGSPLAVYDHSDRKVYYLTSGDEEYMFLKKGTSYVVKLMKQNKYIALNDLKEVKINESQYRALSVKFIDAKGRVSSRTIMPTYVVGLFTTMKDLYRMPNLLFGPVQQKMSVSYARSGSWQ